MRQSRAFTLIELLVVIAIVMLLAAILFPAFNRVRDGGRRSACQSNLKQIGMGLLQYTQDNDEVLVADWYSHESAPGVTDAGTVANARYKWMDAAYPYIKSEQVFTCPAATGERAKPWRYYQNLSGTQTEIYGSYVIMHGYGANQGQKSPPVSHPRQNDLVRVSRAESPTTTAWVTDGSNSLPSGTTFYAQCSDAAEISEIDDRHLETINVLFLDGHVKALRQEVLNRRNSSGVISSATIADD